MCVFAFLFGAAVPALAASGPGNSTLVASRAGAVLTVHFSKPMTAATAARAEAELAQRLSISQSPAAHGPKGAFLYCNHFYRFSDSDGSYTFQHKCRGTTGPWGYQLSTGLCSIVVTDVHEHGIVGNADLVISGSFTSAGCQNRIACGP